MNNQEAIKILGQYDVSNIHFYTTDGEEIPFTEWSDAIEMAISALQAQDLRETQKGLDTISRQEAIDAVEKESQVDGAYGYMDTKSIVDLLNDLPSAQPASQWVPVSERLPKERDKFYQATYLLDDGDRIVDYVYFNSKGVWSNYAYEYSELLAWMPLPEAYKGDK